MTITNCDICGNPLTPNYRNEDTLKGSAVLMSRNPTRVNGIEVREFDFQIVVTTFKFNMTNFHVCNRCIVDAVTRSFAKQEAA